MRKPCVYMLASKTNGTLYLGVTSNLPQRLEQHKAETFEGFTSKYGVKTLVWFECHNRMTDAIQREKSLKKYTRQWKINLIEEANPEWKPLHPIYGHIIET